LVLAIARLLRSALAFAAIIRQPNEREDLERF